MTHLSAKEWRFYFDGEAEPRIVVSNAELFGGGPPFAKPICDVVSGGYYCYLPIPFARSLRIVADITRAKTPYYHINYELYDSGVEVESFPRTPSAEELDRVAAACEVWRENGAGASVRLVIRATKPSPWSCRPERRFRRRTRFRGSVGGPLRADRNSGTHRPPRPRRVSSGSWFCASSGTRRKSRAWKFPWATSSVMPSTGASTARSRWALWTIPTAVSRSSFARSMRAELRNDGASPARCNVAWRIGAMGEGHAQELFPRAVGQQHVQGIPACRAADGIARPLRGALPPAHRHRRDMDHPGGRRIHATRRGTGTVAARYGPTTLTAHGTTPGCSICRCMGS